jgi:uncharacterized repeat protein (TIGR03803 family)
MLALIVLLSLAKSTNAQAFKVLHTFTGHSDGGDPFGGLVSDSSGNFYGTVQTGGANGVGGVFEISAVGKEKVISSFATLADGFGPFGTLVRDADGNLYGTTFFGGDTNCGGVGCGVVFKINTSNKETVLYTFTGGSDGGAPMGGVILDGSGNLYGTTTIGGDLNCNPGGNNPGCGLVFKLSPGGTEKVLYTFTGPDGEVPEASLVMDAAGTLYGTTFGGTTSCGEVFKLTTAGKFKVLHGFPCGGTDGAEPTSAVILDTVGNIYGTTVAGGGGTDCTAPGCGTVFKISTNGTERVLYAFSGGSDGWAPNGALLLDSKGNLFGTTEQGGDLACPGKNGIGCGVVFTLDPHNAFNVLHAFNGSNDGSVPTGPLVQDSQGRLYGDASGGGTNNSGTVFRVTP